MFDPRGFAVAVDYLGETVHEEESADMAVAENRTGDIGLGGNAGVGEAADAGSGADEFGGARKIQGEAAGRNTSRGRSRRVDPVKEAGKAALAEMNLVADPEASDVPWEET